MAANVDSPRVINIADLRRLAKARLPRVAFDYIDGGADAEVTLRENCRVFEDVLFRPRCAVSAPCDLRTRVLGHDLALQVGELTEAKEADHGGDRGHPEQLGRHVALLAVAPGAELDQQPLHGILAAGPTCPGQRGERLAVGGRRLRVRDAGVGGVPLQRLGVDLE